MAGNETEINFTIATVPEISNFWLAGFVVIAVGVRYFVRRESAADTIA